DPTRTVTFGEGSTAEMMFGMFEFTAVDGVSPRSGGISSRMQALEAPFPRGTAYSIPVPQAAQAISAVLHLPKAGEAAWYFSTQGMINVSPIEDLVWTGNAFKFTSTIRLGAGAGPFAVTGDLKEDGTIHGSLESTA